MGELPGLGFPIGKRGRLYGGGSTTTVVVPRCQVEGCHVALLNAKDYHRRHKVCEMHSKSPKVVVLGSEQRFHAVTEFDEAKRSCRRRLAGHNERRRKSSSEASSRNLSQEHRSTSGRYACLSPSTGRALSLLSSNTTTTSWVSPSDISSRSSAALRELIAENRASVLGRQLFLDQFWSHNDSGEAQPTGVSIPNQTQGFAQPLSEWDRFSEAGAQVTLDLMQAPPSPPPFGYHSRRTAKSKDEEEECCELWKSLEGTHVV
ncbi:hypothetical protein GIB67_036508 [Kingdonia uniflora]|uniref:SBP-type domain-containing protein n=1 Tax=Kingdonia uniflora TaxID=39325 RepID=A0A7J7P7K6_9MAGN|nr:hypothetical protein GIB67_036508 [Kingdonia uniflora]